MGANFKSLSKKVKCQVTSDVEQIERDLKACMQCHYFYGNDSRCINSTCYREKKKEVVKDVEGICDDCPYKQEGNYCFPCMKKLLGKA